MRKGRSGYIYKGRVLAVDIPIQKGKTEHYRVGPNWSEELISRIKSAKNGIDDFSQLKTAFCSNHDIRCSETVYGTLIDVFLLSIVSRNLLVPQQAQIDARLQFYEDDLVELLRGLDFESNTFKPVAECLRQFINDVEQHPDKYPQFFVHRGRGVYIVSSDFFKKNIWKIAPRKLTTEWLKDNKILKLSRNKKLCGVHHFPKYGSVRAYIVDSKKLDLFCGQDDDKKDDGSLTVDEAYRLITSTD